MSFSNTTMHYFFVTMLFCSLCFGIAKSAGESPPLVGTTTAVTISKPGQLSLAPSGDRLVVADRFANKILVLDTRGNLLWSVGDGVTLEQPQAALMTGLGEVIFSQWGSSIIRRVSEDNPKIIDTLADLSALVPAKTKIARLYQIRDKSFLVLTENPEQLIMFDSGWTKPRVIVTGGSGKGKLIGATAMTELPASRLAVAGGGDYPVQLFDKTGSFITSADWNSISPQKSWNASAITVDHLERIWAADLTNSKFRIYDITGTLIDVRPFSSPAVRPVGMAVTSDNQLFVINDNGRIDIYNLGNQ